MNLANIIFAFLALVAVGVLMDQGSEADLPPPEPTHSAPAGVPRSDLDKVEDPRVQETLRRMCKSGESWACALVIKPVKML